jgi:hypothetical protein
MIAYNNKWLYNRYVQAQADEALHEQCIDAATHGSIRKKHEVKFYTPNFFVRIGLALLALVILSFVTALFGLMMNVSHAFAYLMIFMGFVSYIAAEILVSTKFHYNSGLDNMLVWIAGLFIWIGIFLKTFWDPTWFGNNPAPVSNADVKLSFAALVICTLLVLRFADTVMSIIATAALLFLAFYSCQHTGVLAKNATPFVLILLFGVVYFMSNRAMRSRTTLLYHNCLLCVNITLLVILYLSGNYYVAAVISHTGDIPGDDMVQIDPAQKALTMGWFFWLWTLLVPVVYIGVGISKKKIMLIRVGIPLLALGVLTFRYYYHIMSPEMAMMLGGMLLFVASYSLINRLHTPRGGFTFSPETYIKDTPDISKLITAELINNAGTTGNKPPDSEWG